MAGFKERHNGGEVSVTDVAKKAKVSIGTVSRVINEHPKVDPVLRRRVQIASRQLGFVPRLQPRNIALITGRRNPSLPIGYVSVMTSLISQYLAANRYAVELIDIENLDLLYDARVLGAIGVVFDDRLVEALKIPKLPLLTINDPLVEHGINSVRADHYQQGLLATEHLISRGHRAIGILTVQGTGEWGARERVRGYTDAMNAAGIPIDPAWIQSTLEHKPYDIVNRWISRKVTAILNFSEDVSLEVLHILGNVLRLRIGKDISVISMEDLPIYQHLMPPQTTVSQPLAELARLAVETTLELCEGKRADNKLVDICLPTELIERDSVATLQP
jgi:DNA-binding LacI/PurR family transcriptional regulator